MNASNHKPGIPLDWLSYHFYSQVGAGTSAAGFGEKFFSDADAFIEEVSEIQQLIALYANTSVTGKPLKNYIDEIGCFYGDVQQAGVPGKGKGLDLMGPNATLYWNAGAAMYSYVFGHFTEIGIEFAGASQLMGVPRLPSSLFPGRPASTDGMSTWTQNP